jgi:hypothetical protein
VSRLNTVRREEEFGIAPPSFLPSTVTFPIHFPSYKVEIYRKKYLDQEELICVNISQWEVIVCPGPEKDGTVPGSVFYSS